MFYFCSCFLEKIEYTYVSFDVTVYSFYYPHHFWINFEQSLFILTSGHILLLLCMPGNFWLDAKHCAFGPVHAYQAQACWVLFFQYPHIPELLFYNRDTFPRHTKFFSIFALKVCYVLPKPHKSRTNPASGQKRLSRSSLWCPGHDTVFHSDLWD